MYAIIESGGKQYQVKEGDVISVEKLSKEKDEKVIFENVLLIADEKEKKVGLPKISGALVEGIVLGIEKGPKVIAYKYKKRKNYHRTVGHRQQYSKLKITKIAM